jgi:hypothetical protein
MLDLLHHNNNNNNNNNSNMEKKSILFLIFFFFPMIFEYSHANASTMWLRGPLNQVNSFILIVMGQKNLLQNIFFL